MSIFGRKKSSSKGGTVGSVLAEREARKQEEREEEVRAVAEETAKTSADIVEKLMNTSFLKSGLPEDVLSEKLDPKDRRYNPDDPRCAMEINCRTLANRLNAQDPSAGIDLRPLDTQLYKLAEQFQTAVQQGNRLAAYVALDALNIGIDKIRKNTPKTNSEFTRKYINENAKYMERWGHLAGQAQTLDKTRDNLESQQAEYNVAKEAEKQELAKLQEMLEKNSVKRAAFKNIYDSKSQSERTSWTKSTNDLYNELLNRYLKKIEMSIQEKLLSDQEEQADMMGSHVRLMRKSLTNLPVIEDENALANFQDAMRKMVQDMADWDAKLNASLLEMGKLEKEIENLESGEGHQRADEAVWKATHGLVEDIRDDQKEQLNRTQNVQTMEVLFGILPQEEVQKQKEQLAQEAAQNVQQSEQTNAVQQNENGDPLYNDD